VSRTSATVLTHRRPAETGAALRALIEAAAAAEVELRLDAEETRKHGLAPAPGLALDHVEADPPDLCLVLGGDGTILTALRHYAGTGVPVFAVNFGEIGFLATVEPGDIAGGCFARAFAGEYEVLDLPAIAVDGPAGVLHGALSSVLQDEMGQILEAHSISAGLDYPGVGPEHSHLRDIGRVRYVSATDQEALAAFQACSRAEGIIPALESSHALALLAREGAELGRGGPVLVCLSGRGDKDVDAVGVALGLDD